MFVVVQPFINKKYSYKSLHEIKIMPFYKNNTRFCSFMFDFDQL